MKSTLDDILPKLQEKYPEVDIPLLIDHYFQIAKQEVEDFTRPEIAFPWGTLVPRPGKIKSHIESIEVRERDFYGKNEYKIPKVKIVKDQLRKQSLLRMLEIINKYKNNGKVKTSFKRKK